MGGRTPLSRLRRQLISALRAALRAVALRNAPAGAALREGSLFRLRAGTGGFGNSPLRGDWEIFIIAVGEGYKPSRFSIRAVRRNLFWGRGNIVAVSPLIPPHPCPSPRGRGRLFDGGLGG